MKLKHGYYDVFIRTCARYSSKTAIRHYTDGIYTNYTYSELYGVCEYISQNLQQLTCNKGIIGLISERNIIIPSVVAAAHKCSTTFMFLDPTHDIEKIADDVKFTIIITIKKLESHASSSSNLLNKKPDKSLRVFNLVVDLYNFGINGSHHSYETNHSYIAMTSGSTGEPKHIQVPIQCMQPNIEDLTKLFEITPSDVIYFSTPLTFDPSMIEILLSCMNGASLLIAPEKADILFPEENENSITFWQTTPSKFFQFSNLDIKNKILSANTTLKTLALGGEPLKGIKRLKELKDTKNNTRIFTLYGVTEMSCWACVAELDLNRILNDREVPLGNCLSETEILLESCHKHNTGKIILASKTRKCMILNKAIGTDEGHIKYIDTGDLGEIKNGTIYYRGRTDDVIKRFGHKVNLQSIETAIMQCPRVKTCSCHVFIWLPKPMLLVVYYSSETLTSQELSDFLKCKLDDKHWPDKILRVDNLPINPHGKTCKQILSQLFENTHITQTFESLKVLLLKELKNLLNRDFTYDEIKETDFFSIGGTSFLAVALCNKISTISPSFGKFILPYLISQKNSIGETMLLAVKELGLEEKNPKKRLKRSRSITDSFLTNQSIKKNMESSSKSAVEFVVLWTYNTGKCVDASPTLFQNGLNLYVTVGSHSGKIVVIDAISGITQGTVKVKSRVEAPVLCYSDPESSTPCGFVGTYDGTIVCFKLENCTEIWRINIGSMIKSKGIYNKGRLYIASYDGVIRCVDATSGEIKHAIHIADQAISADLVLAKNEFILLGTLSGVCASVHSETQAVAWRGTVGSPVFSSPVLYDNDKYVVFAEVNGEIHCRTVEKGIKIWKYQGAKGNIFSSIYIKEVEKFKWRMVFGCHDNKVYSINIKNCQPSLFWKTQLTSPVYSTPCSLKDKYILAASNNGKLCIMYSENGSIVSEYQLPNETFSSPVVYKNFIFIGCRDDNLHCIKFLLHESKSIV